MSSNMATGYAYVITDVTCNGSINSVWNNSLLRSWSVCRTLQSDQLDLDIRKEGTRKLTMSCTCCKLITAWFLDIQSLDHTCYTRSQGFMFHSWERIFLIRLILWWRPLRSTGTSVLRIPWYFVTAALLSRSSFISFSLSAMETVLYLWRMIGDVFLNALASLTFFLNSSNIKTSLCICWGTTACMDLPTELYNVLCWEDVMLVCEVSEWHCREVPSGSVILGKLIVLGRVSVEDGRLSWLGVGEKCRVSE